MDLFCEQSIQEWTMPLFHEFHLVHSWILCPICLTGFWKLLKPFHYKLCTQSVHWSGVSLLTLNMFYAYLEITCTYGGQLSHECPSTMIVLLDIYVHSTTKNKVSMFAIFIRCKKKTVEAISRTNLFFAWSLLLKLPRRSDETYSPRRLFIQN